MTNYEKRAAKDQERREQAELIVKAMKKVLSDARSTSEDLVKAAEMLVKCSEMR